MMRWLPFALIAAACLALADFLVKQATNRLSTSLGMVIYGAVNVVIGLGWVLYQRAVGETLFATRPGLLYAAGVGLAFCGVTLLLYVTFARVEVSLGSPVIRLTGIVLASLLGILLLREPLTWRYVLGVVLAVAGVALIVAR
jgi:drug/metabolite transporter (DMT)-like permease